MALREKASCVPYAEGEREGREGEKKEKKHQHWLDDADKIEPVVVTCLRVCMSVYVRLSVAVCACLKCILFMFQRGDCNFPWQWNIVFCAELQMCKISCVTVLVFFFCFFLRDVTIFSPFLPLTNVDLVASQPPWDATHGNRVTEVKLTLPDHQWCTNFYFDRPRWLLDSSGCRTPRAAISEPLPSCLPPSPPEVNCSRHGNNDSA